MLIGKASEAKISGYRIFPGNTYQGYTAVYDFAFSVVGVSLTAECMQEGYITSPPSLGFSLPPHKKSSGVANAERRSIRMVFDYAR